MGFGYCSFASTFLLIILTFLLVSTSAILSPNFYSSSCPQALNKIRKGVERAIDIEKRMGASLLRLHFHDCFVQKCDGSILLDDNATFTGEKTAFPNANSVRGFEVIDNIKAELEQICPGVVSCADILTVAARDSVVALGGPSWTVPLGRRDSRTANLTEANIDLPPPFANLTFLISAFAKKNLSTRDLVVLSGTCVQHIRENYCMLAAAHTIGSARCTIFRDRIYNDTNIDPAFAAVRRSKCPRTGGDNNLSPLDLSTPNRFDNQYYDNLLHERGLLHSDQELFNGGSTDSLVSFYSSNTNLFFNDFAIAMVKMGNIALTGAAGEVRVNCRRVN